MEVYIKKGDLSVPTRLVIEAVPAEIKAERLRKLNQTSKKKGRVTKKRTKLFQGFNLYISNIPDQMARFTTTEFEDFKSSYPSTVSLISEHVKVRKDYVYIDCNRFAPDLKVDPEASSALKIAIIKILVAANFRSLYSIRWQIELIFKNWKSNFALDKITGKKPERIRSMVYAKLLYIFIATKIIFVAKSYAWLHHRREVSDLQAGQEFKILSSEWLRVAIRRPHETKQMLLSILETLIYECLKSKQNTRTYPLDTLEQIFHA